MKKVALATVGCRLNQYETEKIAAQLVAAGMKRVAYKDRADLYILNSCTVTGRADADCRKLINRARRLNDRAVVVVTGCYVVSQPQQIEDLNAADLTVDNKSKPRLPEILRDRFPDLFDVDAGTKEVAATADTARAMVKIGDGCNQYCSYCIVPGVRGPLKSLPADHIIKEIRQLVAGGFHEVVLTAVHIGKYDYGGLNLSGLVEMILDRTVLSRLRLSSLEPNELDDKLIDFVAAHPRVCRHLHLPLQSGSDRILKPMRRPYRSRDYLKIIEAAKSANPDITLGCDLIVGFPGETEDDFRASLEILDSGCIDYAHVFSYSDRHGTAAADLPDKINPRTIKERNRRARQIGESRRRLQMKRQIGQTLEVISELTPHDESGYFGISDNYMKVLIPSEAGGTRKIIGFRPTALSGGHLEGEATEQ